MNGDQHLFPGFEKTRPDQYQRKSVSALIYAAGNLKDGLVENLFKKNKNGIKNDESKIALKFESKSYKEVK